MLYLKRGAKVVGPFALDKVKQGLDSRQLSGGDLASPSPTGPWEPLSRLISSPPQAAGQTSTSRNDTDHEPSELWLLVCEVWQKVGQRLREKKSEVRVKKRVAVEDSPRPHSDGLISPTFASLVIIALVLSGFVYYRMNVVTKVMNARAGGVSGATASSSFADDSDVSISSRYRNKFQDLYDQVKGDLEGIGQVQRRDMQRFAKELKSKAALLPKEDSASLQRIGGKLQQAAASLARAAELFVTQGEAEVALETSGGPYRVGGMSSETEQMFTTVVEGSKQQIQHNLRSARDYLKEVEGDPLFKRLMR